MVYTCERTGCHFSFETMAQPHQCPDCGGTQIRPAQAAEIQQFRLELHRGNIVTYAGEPDAKR